MLGVFVVKYPSKSRTPAELQAIIDNLDSIISQLMTTALTEVAKVGIAEYELDTGQSRTQLRYTSATQITAAIEAYERLRKLYWNMLYNQSGSMRLVDEKNFKLR